MGNWIRTTVEAKNIKNLDIFDDNNVIDFNKIVAEPATKQECPTEYLFTENNVEHIGRSERKPWFNWGKWRKTFWGTYTNADDAEIETNRNDMIVFDTKGATPLRAIVNLSKLNPELTFVACCEDIDDNYPPIFQTTWKNGKMITAATANFEWDLSENAKTDGKYGEMNPTETTDMYNV